VSGAGIGICVLRLEMGEHFGGVLLAEPLIRICERVAVMSASVRALGGDGCVCHHSTVVQVKLTGAVRGARIDRGRLTEAKPTVNSSFVTPITSAHPFFRQPKANGGNRSPHCRAGDLA